MSKRDRITQAAKDFLAKEPAGLKYSVLIERLEKAFPDVPPGSGNFSGAVWNLATRFPDEIYKPARGLFRLTRFQNGLSAQEASPDQGSSGKRDGPRESDFYGFF
mgnify:CR=1 FL=1